MGVKKMNGTLFMGILVISIFIGCAANSSFPDLNDYQINTISVSKDVILPKEPYYNGKFEAGLVGLVIEERKEKVLEKMLNSDSLNVSRLLYSNINELVMNTFPASRGNNPDGEIIIEILNYGLSRDDRSLKIKNNVLPVLRVKIVIQNRDGLKVWEKNYAFNSYKSNLVSYSFKEYIESPEFLVEVYTPAIESIVEQIEQDISKK